MSRPDDSRPEEPPPGDAPIGPASKRRRPDDRHLLPAFLLVSLVVCAAGYLTVRLLPDRVGKPYDTDIFYHQFMLHEGPGAILTAALLAGALLMAFAVPARATEGLLRWLAIRPGLVACAAFVLLAAASLRVYLDHPFAMDEYMSRFQAQIFAEGEIHGYYPPDLMLRLVPLHFLNKTFIAASLTTGKIVSTYSPGFALMLAPFVKLGVPWLLNPLLAAATLLLIWHLARKLYGDALAPGWALLLTLASPAFTVNAISYYSLTAHLGLNLLFMALLLDRTPPRMLAAGLAGSLAMSLHHPVPHALFALPWLAWLVKRWEWKHLGALAAGYLLVAPALTLGWLRVRGVISAENRGVAVPGPEPPGTTSTLTELSAFAGILQLPDAELLAARLMACFKLFFWAAPGLPILALLAWPAVRRRPALRLLAWSAAATFVFYLFVRFNQGHGWGYRYFHSAWGALPLLATAAVLHARRQAPRWRRLVASAAVLSLVIGTGLRFGQVHGAIARHLAQVATAGGGVPQVRFVEVQSGYYVQDLIQNDPFLRGPVWTFLSFGRESDAELVRRRFPGARLAVDRGSSTAWIVE